MIPSPGPRRGEFEARKRASLPARRDELEDTERKAPGSAWTDAAEAFLSPRFWLIGIVFLAAYLALNVMTARYQFHALGITLWSPDDGLTVLVLMEGSNSFPSPSPARSWPTSWPPMFNRVFTQ